MVCQQYIQWQDNVELKVQVMLAGVHVWQKEKKKERNYDLLNEKSIENGINPLKMTLVRTLCSTVETFCNYCDFQDSVSCCLISCDVRHLIFIDLLVIILQN